MNAAHSQPGSRVISLGLLAVIALGIALRVSRINHGLPDVLEEATPLRVGLAMWAWPGHARDLNPHVFQYPSLTFYLHYVIQKLAYLGCHLAGHCGSPADYLLDFISTPARAVRWSRALSILSDGLAILCAGRLGRRFGTAAGISAAAMTALAPTLIVTSSAIFTDSVMMALSLGAIERMAAHLESRGPRCLIESAILVGLATGAKYSAAGLVVPLAWAVWSGTESRRWRTLLTASGIVLVMFLLTTPYAVLDAPTFVRDVASLGDRLAAGQLGVIDRPGAAYYLGLLARNVGWAGLLGVLFSVPLAMESSLARLIWLGLLSFAIPTALARAEFDRYLVPLLPLAAILASGGGAWLAGRLALRRTAQLASWGVGVALLVLPLLPAALHEATEPPSTQSLARRWFETKTHLADLVVQEAYGAELLTEARRNQVIQSSLFAGASPAARLRFLSCRWYHMVGMPLVVAGLSTTRGGDSSTSIVRHAVDLNAPVYDLRLFHGVDYVVTSSSVRDRFAADTVRFHPQLAFYRFLDQCAERVVAFDIRHGSGPTIRVYSLGERAQDAILARGPLDSQWWTKALAHSEPQASEAVRSVYRRWYGPFLAELIAYEHDSGRCRDALALARVHLVVSPEDSSSLVSALQCAGSMGSWWDARALAESLLPIYARNRWRVPELSLEYAKVLAHTGELQRARNGLERLSVTARGDVALKARQQLHQLPPE